MALLQFNDSLHLNLSTKTQMDNREFKKTVQVTAITSDDVQAKKSLNEDTLTKISK